MENNPLILGGHGKVLENFKGKKCGNPVNCLVIWSVFIGQTLMDRRIRPWVNKKIVEYIGEDEPTLSEFICKKVISHSSPSSILADISMVSVISLVTVSVASAAVDVCVLEIQKRIIFTRLVSILSNIYIPATVTPFRLHKSVFNICLQ